MEGVLAAKKQELFGEPLFINKMGGDQFSIVADGNASKKISNPYMLETEVCSKCYE